MEARIDSAQSQQTTYLELLVAGFLPLPSERNDGQYIAYRNGWLESRNRDYISTV